jgi:hypothetical protein
VPIPPVNTVQPQPGAIVQPAGRVCRFPGIVAFKPGVWNGENVTLDDLRAMADNFRQFSTGPNPHYVPFVSLNHKDELNCGKVDGCRMEGDSLVLDAKDVPEEVGQWRNAGRLNGPSIEFWRPVYEGGQLVGSFMRPDGTYSPTPVLKSVTLLGNEAPGVKGLPPLPVAIFSQQGVTHRFGADTMDRTATLAALQAAGADVSKVTDAVPDEVLSAWLASLQAAAQQAKPADNNGNAAATPVVQMADANAPAIIPQVTPAPIAGGAGGNSTMPTSVTLKFADNYRPTPGEQALLTYLNQNGNVLQGIAARGAAVAAQLKAERDRSKAETIVAFADRMAKKVPPEFLKKQCAILSKLDHDNVRKFADGKSSGTELQEAIADFEATWIPPREFAEKISQPLTGPNQPGQPMDPARKAAILANDPLFRGLAAKKVAPSGKN